MLPFLLVVALFDGLATTFPTFHGSDESVYHFPIVTDFFHQWPALQLADYHSATTPLFHVVFALFAKGVGLDLPRLRLINVALSVAAVLVFHDLACRLAERRDAFVCALLFGLSPYFFGASFLLLTDNLGILLALLALRCAILNSASFSMRRWLWLCVFICFATLTRQVYVWLAVGLLPGLALDRAPMRRRVTELLTLALACVPLLLFFAVWHGMTPPMLQQHHVGSGLTARAAFFGIGIYGLFAALLFPDRLWQRLRALRLPGFVALASVTVLALLLMPMNAQPGDDGIVWRVTHWLPKVAGSGLVFWVFFPLGLLYFIDVLRSELPRRVLAGWLGLAFVLSNLPNLTIYEKYFDPFTIALLVVSESEASPSPRLTQCTRLFALACFAAYPFVSGRLSS